MGTDGNAAEIFLIGKESGSRILTCVPLLISHQHRTGLRDIGLLEDVLWDPCEIVLIS
jgi:hypothetical protein